MKRAVIALSLMSASLCVTAQDSAMTYFSCGFEEGIPSSAAVYDKDGFELHYTMTQNGFAKTDSWIWMLEEGTENHFAASASRFKDVDGKKPGAASDWLVFAPVWIRDADANLSWVSRSVNDQSSRPSTYSVFVSETGPDPSCFTSAALATVTETSLDEWSAHSVALGDYAGKRVYIAFVNESMDAEILGIDNVTVSGGPGLADLEITPGRYALGSDHRFSIGGVLTASSDETVTSLSVSCDINGRRISADYDGLALKRGESFSFTFPEEVEADFGECVSYTVNAVVNGVEFDPVECATTVLAFLPERRVVIEEVTGMWCQYCPKGIVAFDILQERYPDTFIGIAVHMMAEADPLALDHYANSGTFPGGAPSGWIDRKVYSTDPMVPVLENGSRTFTTLMGGFETLLLERLEEVPMADIALKADAGGGELAVDAEMRFPVDYADADLRLAVVVTEDHVWQKGYYQANVFSGSSETLAGFENRPQRITDDMEFNHVARAIYDDYHGIAGSLPSRIEAGETYSFTHGFKAPEAVLDWDNVKVIGMVIDNATGEILNAVSVKPAVAGIGSVSADAGYTISHEAGRITVSTASPGEPLAVSVIDMSGRAVSVSEGRGVVTLDVSSLSGVYLLRVATSGAVSTAKIVL